MLKLGWLGSDPTSVLRAVSRPSAEARSVLYLNSLSPFVIDPLGWPSAHDWGTQEWTGLGLLFSVQLSCSVCLSDSLRLHEPPHARLPCPSPTPGVHPNSCPLSWWCYLTISSSVVPFSSFPQSFSASGSFQRSQLFVSCGQNIGVSVSSSVLPMNAQDWFPLGWTGWISLVSKGLSRVFSSTTVMLFWVGTILLWLASRSVSAKLLGGGVGGWMVCVCVCEAPSSLPYFFPLAGLALLPCLLSLPCSGYLKNSPSETTCTWVLPHTISCWEPDKKQGVSSMSVFHFLWAS